MSDLLSASNFSTSFASQPLMVRDALMKAREAWQGWGMPDALSGTAEQVLAEALNNIVEHAFKESPDGTINLSCDLRADGLRCLIEDAGVPMPNEQLPEGRLAEHDGTLEDLPEGGFGWFMIRALTQDLRYARDGHRNQLSFLIPTDGLL